MSGDDVGPRWWKPPIWTLVASDAEPPMYFCPDCGGDLPEPVNNPNAEQMCPICAGT